MYVGTVLFIEDGIRKSSLSSRPQEQRASACLWVLEVTRVLKRSRGIEVTGHKIETIEE